MLLKTALDLLENGRDGEYQLFFGNIIIYDRDKLVCSCGVGTFLHTDIKDKYMGRKVISVEWLCHCHSWSFYLK